MLIQKIALSLKIMLMHVLAKMISLFKIMLMHVLPLMFPLLKIVLMHVLTLLISLLKIMLMHILTLMISLLKIMLIHVLTLMVSLLFFQTQMPWKLSISMINKLSCKFQQCLGQFTMFSSKDPLKIDFLDIYLITFSESVLSEIKNLWESSFYSRYSKSNLDFRNGEKNWEKVVCFWDNCIWIIGIVRVSLLRKGYLSLAANVLTSSPKTWHVNKRDFFQLKWLESYQ